MSPYTVDVTAATFDEAVLRGSMKVPVIVDFWAPWCGPCRALTPVLEKLAAEYKGKFLLAKINSDENQTLAMDWNVRGIPNVKAFVNGKLAGEFSGALPESAVRQFIERLLPSPGEELRRAALREFTAGRAEEALGMLDRAASLDAANTAIPVDRAEVLLSLGRNDEARALLDGLDVFAREEGRAKALMARLNIASAVADAPNEATLRARIAANADDLDARLKLANLYAAAERYEPALSELLEVVKRNRAYGDDAARKQMVALFSLLGDRDERVGRYRRELASALN